MNKFKWVIFPLIDSMDKVHDDIYPFDMTHIQETILNRTQRTNFLKLARYT